MASLRNLGTSVSSVERGRYERWCKGLSSSICCIDPIEFNESVRICRSGYLHA